MKKWQRAILIALACASLVITAGAAGVATYRAINNRSTLPTILILLFWLAGLLLLVLAGRLEERWENES